MPIKNSVVAAAAKGFTVLRHLVTARNRSRKAVPTGAANKRRRGLALFFLLSSSLLLGSTLAVPPTVAWWFGDRLPVMLRGDVKPSESGPAKFSAVTTQAYRRSGPDPGLLLSFAAPFLFIDAPTTLSVSSVSCPP